MNKTVLLTAQWWRYVCIKHSIMEIRNDRNAQIEETEILLKELGVYKSGGN